MILLAFNRIKYGYINSILFFLTCFNNYIYIYIYIYIETMLLVKNIVLAKMNKRYVDREIYLRKNIIQNNCMFVFNNNAKKFHET